MRLSDLKTGEEAYIVKVKGHGGFRKRIIEMGFIKGQKNRSIAQCSASRPCEIQGDGL